MPTLPSAFSLQPSSFLPASPRLRVSALKLSILLIFLSAFSLQPSAFSQNLFVYSADGKKILSNPRDLPAHAVRLDTRQTVLGLHAATPALKAACGWYRVVPSPVKPATNQTVTARAYAITGNTAVETLTLTNRVRRTPRQRLDAILADVPGADTDARLKAALALISQAIADRLSTQEPARK